MKRIFLLPVLAVFAFFGSFCFADTLPVEGPAPYAPIASAYSDDNYSYDDGTLSIRVQADEYINENSNATKIYFVYVKITDPSQLRAAIAGAPKSAKTETAVNLAKRNNAVLAINGDFYNFDNGITKNIKGVVIRQGQMIRNNPSPERDALIIDENADLHIIPSLTADDLNTFSGQHEVRNTFCFGPGLIIDGQTQSFDYRKKISCGYPTRAQRMIFCQTGPLEYLFLATEGPEQDQPGLSVPECVGILEKLGTVRQAYNLDGGNSTSVVMNGEKLNAANYKIRDIGDIIYFATLVNP